MSDRLRRRNEAPDRRARPQRFQEALLRLMAELLARDSQPDLYQRVLDEAVAIIPGAQAGSVLLRGDDGMFRFVAAVGYDLAALQQVELDYFEVLFMSPEPVASRLVRDFPRLDREMLDPERYRLLREVGRIEEIQVSLMVPIRIGGEVAASLLLDNMADPQAFSGEARRMAELFGANIGVVLKRLRLEAQLRRSQAQLVKLFQNTPVPTVLLDLEALTVADVNRAFVALVGCPREALLEREVAVLDLLLEPQPFVRLVRAARRVANRDAHRDANPDTHRDTHRDAPSGEASAPAAAGRTLELRLRTRDGCQRWCLAAVEVVTVDGRDHALCTFLDITDRRRTEEQLTAAVRAVLEDASWFSASVMEKLAQLRGEPASSALADLTPREREVLGHIAAGRTNAEIAEVLSLSPQTVRNYAARVYGKLGVHSRAEAVVWARERGLVAE